MQRALFTNCADPTDPVLIDEIVVVPKLLLLRFF
jgi:hypothetical protein